MAQVKEIFASVEDVRGVFSGIMKNMPRELLLILRNQNYVRALSHEMGIYFCCLFI